MARQKDIAKMFLVLAVIISVGTMVGSLKYLSELKNTPGTIHPKPLPPASTQNPPENTDIDISDWRTYRNEEYNFEFKYPGDWSYKETIPQPSNYGLRIIFKDSKDKIELTYDQPIPEVGHEAWTLVKTERAGLFTKTLFQPRPEYKDYGNLIFAEWYGNKFENSGQFGFNYEEENDPRIKILDQILSTFKFIEQKSSFSCGSDTVKDIDGNSYKTVQIDSQCWLKENLKVTKDPDSKAITRYCYNNDSKICDTDGGLYDWNTAMSNSLNESAQGICPSGWHIPTETDWHNLENYLKDSEQACRAETSIEWSCKTAGTKLKEGGSSGFEGLLAGERDSGGSFVYQGGAGDFWSSTEVFLKENTFFKNGNYTHAWIRGLASSSSGVSRNQFDKNSGLSVRCIKN